LPASDASSSSERVAFFGVEASSKPEIGGVESESDISGNPVSEVDSETSGKVDEDSSFRSQLLACEGWT
jgi:hypothetical protein